MGAPASGRAVELNRHIATGRDSIYCLADLIDVREQDIQLVGAQHDQGDPAARQVLLVPNVLVSREEYLEAVSLGSGQEIAICQPGPAPARSVGGIVTRE